MKFLNILLQKEANPVKKMRLHLFYSAVIVNSKLDYYVHQDSKYQERGMTKDDQRYVVDIALQKLTNESNCDLSQS